MLSVVLITSSRAFHAYKTVHCHGLLFDYEDLHKVICLHSRQVHVQHKRCKADLLVLCFVIRHVLLSVNPTEVGIAVLTA